MPTIAGNYPDPDARVLDSLVESHAEPPTPDKLPIAPNTALPLPKQLTRLATGSMTVLPSWAPTLLMPQDGNRTGLRIKCQSATATDILRISDDLGKVQALSSSGLLYAGETYFSDATHTGPVWLYCPDAVGPITASFITVTS